MKQWKTFDKPLILASQSPRRRDLLQKMGVAFSAETPNIDDEEIFFQNEPLEKAIVSLAIAKAHTVAQHNRDALVIGSDTVVFIDSDVIGKPKDKADAKATLQKLSGRTHTVLTAVALESITEKYSETVIASTQVTFRKIPEWELEAYLDIAHYMDKAGAYAIQEEGLTFVKTIEGCYYNVVGFPITSVITLFENYSNR